MQSMKRAFATAGLGLLVPATALAGEPCWPATADNPLEPEMVVMTSGGSVATTMEEVFWSKFGAACGVEVKTYTLANRSLDQMQTLIESGNVPFDMFTTFSGQRYPQLIEAGLLQKLPDGIWAGLEDKLIEGAYSEYGVWSSPYTTTMIYNAEVFPNGLKSWADFWDVDAFPGPRILQDNPSNVVFALLSTGMPTSEIYPITDDKLALAYEQLSTLRPHLRNFWKTGDQPVQGVGSREFVAGTAWNGRAAKGIKQGFPIGINWEGNLLATSWFVVAKGAKSPRAAAAAIRFLQNPELQANFAGATGYSGPVKGLEKFLTPEVYATLASNADNAAVASVIDNVWWAANEERMTTIWSKWVATGVFEPSAQ